MSPIVARRSVVLTSFAALLAVAANSAYQWQRAAPFGWSGLCLQFESYFTDGGRTHTSRLRIEDVEPRSPASHAGLRRGERIVALDGSPDALIRRFAAVRAGSTVRLDVIGGQAQRQVAVTTLPPFSVLRVPLTLVFRVVLAGIALSLGLFVLTRRREDRRALLLFVLMVLYALLHFADAGPMHRYGVDSEANLTEILVVVSAGLLFFPVLLHLFLIFPSRRPLLDRFPSVLRQIYAPPAYLAIGATAFLLAVIRIVPPESSELKDLVTHLYASSPTLASLEPLLLAGLLLALAIAGPRLWRGRSKRSRTANVLLAIEYLLLLGTAVARSAALSGAPVPSAAPVLLLLVAVTVFPVLIVLVVYPIAACIACARTYKEAGAEERRQLRWPLLGLLLAIGGYFLTAPLIRLVAFVQDWPPDSAAQLAVWWYGAHARELAFLLIPVSMAFAILRYRLFDIDVYIRRTIIYGALTSILAVVFVFVIAGTGTLLAQSLAVEGSWSPIAATVVAGVLVLPLRTRIQTAVDSRFYRRRDYPAALARIIARMAVEPDQYGPVVVEVQEAIPARSASLWLRSSEAPVYELRAHSGPVMPDLPLRIAASEAEDRLRSAGDYIQEIARGEGFLLIGSKLADTAWDDHDRNFLAAVSGQIALATSTTARDEADRAAEIQRALLPAAIPQPEGLSIAALSQPARNVGGDYYDVICIDRHRVALAVADVSGKGVPAALLMSNVQAALRLLAVEAKSPSELCSRLNHHMCGNVTPGRFVTCFYGVLDLSSGVFRYCNAGHNAPVVTRGRPPVLRLETGGIPLGIIPGYSYSESTITLEPGDRLILFTDGVCDATDEQEQDFGDGGLLAALAAIPEKDAGRVLDDVFTRIARHCGGVFSDDVTLVVASYRGPPGSVATASPGAA